jgi:hypothetical protein
VAGSRHIPQAELVPVIIADVAAVDDHLPAGFSESLPGQNRTRSASAPVRNGRSGSWLPSPPPGRRRSAAIETLPKTKTQFTVHWFRRELGLACRPVVMLR